MEDVPEVPSNGRSGPEHAPTKEERDRELDRMAANVRWLRAWGHLRMKPRTVSRDEAFDLARDVADPMDRDVREVVDHAELALSGSRTPFIYNVDLSNCWIAYLAPLRVGLGPSDIVAIDKVTGAVRYTGSANDER